MAITNARDEAIAAETITAVGALLRGMKTREEQGAALGYLLMAAYKPLRMIEGDEFVRGWLERALREVQTTPPDVQLVDLH